MVRLRLRKVGSKAQQSFRLVAAESEHPRDGRFLENLGTYNPRTTPATIVLDEARVLHWLKNGASPSESALKLFKVTGTLDRLARLKAGEPLETLAAEAAEAAAKRNTASKTGASTGAAHLSKKKKAAAAKAAAA
ncbi:MAG: 30S ribosomal protein S16 [Anaerolineales bacterium]|nr:30S ribosomal protein S16 [Anaerolineales bacterium]